MSRTGWLALIRNMTTKWYVSRPQQARKKELTWLTLSQIDSDFYLPVLMNQYFVQNSVGQSRADSFSR